ncbi:MAG: hemerythrin domain-containing protein [Rugosibacter sp.]|nr:hemerythrin domain-containing protein [Rugosibacter sp.]
MQQLSREHHAALVFARKIELAESGEGIRLLAKAVPDYFSAELAPHFYLEETQLLPQLAIAGYPLLVDRVLEEHGCLRELLRQIARDNEDDHTSDNSEMNMKTFGKKLSLHVRFEERELFAVAQTVLSDDFLQFASDI